MFAYKVAPYFILTSKYCVGLRWIGGGLGGLWCFGAVWGLSMDPNGFGRNDPAPVSVSRDTDHYSQR